MGLEAKLVEINKTHYEDKTSTVWGIDDRLVCQLASEGWQMTTAIDLSAVSRGNVVLGLFYRKVADEPKAAPKVEPKAKKDA